MSFTFSIPSPRVHRIAVSTFFFIAGFTFASWAARIPDIKSKLLLSDAGLGAVLFALPVGLMVGLPASGYLVARIGSRKVVIIAALLYPLTLILLGIAPTIWLLSATLFVFGFWGNLFNISVNTQAVGVEALYGRSIMASFHGIWSLAGFAGAAVGTVMIAVHFTPFVHYCIIAATAFLLVIISFPYTLAHNDSNATQPIFAKPDASILHLGLIAFGCLVCEGTMFDWSGVYFQKVIQVPKSYTTLGYVAFMSSMAGGRFIADWLATKMGIKTMLQCSGIIITTGLLTAVVFPYIIPATIGFLLVGLGVSSVVPLVYGLAGKSKTMLPGVALAAVSTIGFLGFLVGPPLIGLIAGASSLRWSFTVIAITGLLTTILAGKVKTR
ncbi:MAG: major facilitator superfamily [Ferruginibacter sp.]|nr:major facilitator superfamily [Ferruginibacter sp.]